VQFERRTEASAQARLLRPDHHRPLTVLAETLPLDPNSESPGLVADCLKPFDSALMKKYPVGTRVNRPENDDAEFAREVSG
jgi:hypothetical protein